MPKARRASGRHAFRSLSHRNRSWAAAGGCLRRGQALDLLHGRPTPLIRHPQPLGARDPIAFGPAPDAARPQGGPVGSARRRAGRGRAAPPARGAGRRGAAGRAAAGAAAGAGAGAPRPGRSRCRRRRRPARSPKVATARFRPRHWGLIASFLLVVLLPAATTTTYLYTRTADQYHSTTAFSIRSEEVSAAAAGILGAITQMGSGTASDINVLFDFIRSQRMVETADAKLDLRGDVQPRPAGLRLLARQGPLDRASARLLAADGRGRSLRRRHHRGPGQRLHPRATPTPSPRRSSPNRARW